MTAKPRATAEHAFDAPDKVIIVGGVPRSGKSLVRNVLTSHSAVAMPPTAFRFIGAYGGDAFHRGGYKAGLERFLASDQAKRWGIKADAGPRNGVTERDLYVGILDAYRQSVAPMKPLVGEYTHYSEEHLQQYFEWFGADRVRFIQLVRDPVDTFASWVVSRGIAKDERRSDDHRAVVYRFLDAWTRSTLIGLTNGTRYPASCLTMFFEDAKADPVGFVERLTAFLGLPAETDAMLEMTGVDDKPKRNSAFVADARDGAGVGFVRADRADRASVLLPYEVEVLENAAAADVTQLLGYRALEDRVDLKARTALPAPRFRTKARIAVRALGSSMPRPDYAAAMARGLAEEAAHAAGSVAAQGISKLRTQAGRAGRSTRDFTKNRSDE